MPKPTQAVKLTHVPCMSKEQQLASREAMTRDPQTLDEMISMKIAANESTGKDRLPSSAPSGLHSQLANDTSNFDFMELPDAYGLVSLSAGAAYTQKSGNLIRFGMDIQNLFNTSYRNYMNRLRYYADEAGRNINLSIKYIF